MRPRVRDVTDQIVEDLMGLDSNEQRREVLAVIGLIFCGSCGRASSELEVLHTSTASACIHGRDLKPVDNTITGTQQRLDQEEADVKGVARMLRGRYPSYVL